MSLPISITFTFASQSSTIPLQDLDTNFTLLVNTLNGIGNGNVSLANVQITGGSIANAVTFLAGNVTLGNTLVALGTTASNIGNLTLLNANIATLSSPLQNSSLANSNVIIGNTTIILGSTAANIGNVTLANPTITSGIFSNSQIVTSSATGQQIRTGTGTTSGGTGSVSFATSFPTACDGAALSGSGSSAVFYITAKSASGLTVASTSDGAFNYLAWGH